MTIKIEDLRIGQRVWVNFMNGQREYTVQALDARCENGNHAVVCLNDMGWTNINTISLEKPKNKVKKKLWELAEEVDDEYDTYLIDFYKDIWNQIKDQEVEVEE